MVALLAASFFLVLGVALALAQVDPGYAREELEALAKYRQQHRRSSRHAVSQHMLALRTWARWAVAPVA